MDKHQSVRMYHQSKLQKKKKVTSRNGQTAAFQNAAPEQETASDEDPLQKTLIVDIAIE